MVSVEKCCGCVKLSTGGIILGCFGAFSSLLLIIVIGGFLLNYENFVSQSYAKGSHGDEDSKKIAIFLETYKNVVLTVASTYLLLQGFSFISSLSLVCGSIHKRPKFLIASLVSQAILTIFWVLGSALTSDFNMTIYAMLCGYFWICVYSLYKSMHLDFYQQQHNSFHGVGAV